MRQLTDHFSLSKDAQDGGMVDYNCGGSAGMI